MWNTMAEIQSLARAFEILHAVAATSDGQSLAEITRQVDLPKSTVSRMLTTLEKLGAVERLGPSEGFRIGSAIVTLAAQVAYPRTLAALARPYLQTLAQAAGETVCLSVLEGDQVYYIDQIDSWRNLRLKDWTGQRLPLYATSDGKLFLSDFSAEALEAYLRQPLTPYSANTLTDPHRLRQALAEIRQQGFAWNQREYDPDLVGLAAPIRDQSGRMVASICVFGPFFRFPPAGQRDAMIELTVQTAVQISERLQAFAGRLHEETDAALAGVSSPH
jgi:IclR family acetate operon transcriptional repressor